MTEITRYSPNAAVIATDARNKDEKHRLNKFSNWLDESGYGWAAPDLQAYRDYLLYDEELAPESVAVHLSSVRSRYHTLLLDRRMFFALVPEQDTFAERKALVDELIARIEAAIDPRSAPVRTSTYQDRPDSEHLRLSREQMSDLLMQPDNTTLAGARDRAVIAMLLSTGIREAELCGLRVPDLEETFEGALALHVRMGKGRKSRMVPYGNLLEGLRSTKTWLRRAAITDGFVFRGLRKGDNIRKTSLNERTIQKILARYPIWVNRQLIVVRPHDCRRTYARRLYEAGVKVDAIRLNMGHDSIEMTFHYIGAPDISDRLPPDVFSE